MGAQPDDEGILFPIDFVTKSLGLDKKAVLATMYLRFFGLSKIPLLYFVRPSVQTWDNDRFVVKIPLKRRTKNHLGSMYFGVLAAGADLAAGFVAMDAIRLSGERVSLIFKDMQAEFLKRAEDTVHFTCDEGILIKDLVEKAIETGDRVEMPVHVTATVPSKLGDEAVARFTLTLSLKRKDKKQVA